MADSKLKRVLWYLCHLDERLHMGSVRMLKTILFAEVISQLHYNHAIVGNIFIKASYGPVPRGYKEALQELQAEGKINIVTGALKYSETQYAAIIVPDDIYFGLSPFEVDILEATGERICDRYTATMISAHTHNEFWDAFAPGESVPIDIYFPYENNVKITPGQAEFVQNAIKKEIARLETSV